MHDLLSILDFIIFKHLFCGCSIYFESQSAKKDSKSIQPHVGFLINRGLKEDLGEFVLVFDLHIIRQLVGEVF